MAPKLNMWQYVALLWLGVQVKVASLSFFAHKSSTAISFSCKSQRIARGCVLQSKLEGNNDADSRRKSRQGPKKPSKFDRIIDDFVGKRFGAGEAFYGKRTSALSDEEYDDFLQDSRRKLPGGGFDGDNYDSMALKDNAILLVGDAKRAEIMRWIAFELLEKDFSVRIATSDYRGAVDTFGRPGFNVDIVTIGAGSSEADYQRCLSGVQAVVLLSGFMPPLAPWDFGGDRRVEEEFVVAKRMIGTATKMEGDLDQDTEKDGIAKLVFLSRYYQRSDLSSSALAEVQQGGSVLEYLSNVLFFPSTISVDTTSFDPFRHKHRDFEAVVRSSGFDHLIVQCPPVLDGYETILNTASTLFDSFVCLTYRGAGSIDELALFRSDIGRSSTTPPLIENACATMSLLDLAEVSTQGLLCDFLTQHTFFVSRNRRQSSRLILGDDEEGIRRIRRSAYYAILDLDAATEAKGGSDKELSEEELEKGYADMRAGYSFRSMDDYKNQLEEDGAVEEYWREVFKQYIR